MFKKKGAKEGPYSVVPAKKARRPRANLKSVRNMANYSELDRIFELQRLEHEAAKVLQGFWRRSKVLLPWRRAVFLQKKAIQIQRIVRGMLGRKWVALWYNTRTNIIVCWQACTRRFNSNLRTRKLLAIDQQMAIRIQKIVRAKLARIKCRRLLEDMAATRIQILWRGVMGRVRADKSWIQKTVIPIQKIARRMIVVKKFRKSCEGYNHAATLIQKCFRSWRSYRAMGEKLWKRELDYRGDSVHMLQSDEDFSQEKLEKLIHRLTKTGMKEKAEDDLKRLLDYQNAVYRKENDLIEINRQLDILSPRAIKLGFKEELEKNRTALRAELTEMKSRCLFELSIEVYANDELLEDRVVEIEQWAVNKEKVGEWRDLEYEEMRHLTYQRDILTKRKERRMAVAEERRKWACRWYTRDGKPDKNRRPGRPFSAAAFAGADKQTYSGAGVDLLAHVNHDEQKRRERKQAKNQSTGKKGAFDTKSANDPSDRVDGALRSISLQTYLDEVNMYQQLLEPIAKIMREGMGAPPNKPGPQDLGWGAVGAELPSALHGIGALPPHWNKKEKAADPLPGKNKKSLNKGRNYDHGESSTGNESARSIDSTFDDVSADYRPPPFSLGISGKCVEDGIGFSGGGGGGGGVPGMDRLDLPPVKPSARATAKKSGKMVDRYRSALLHSASVQGMGEKEEEEEEKGGGGTRTIGAAGGGFKFSSAAHVVASTKKAARQAERMAKAREEELERIMVENERRVREAHEQKMATAEKRNARKRQIRRTGIIPWELLDQLDGEKTRWESDVAYQELYHKF